MKNIKLFEQFNTDPASEVLNALSSDPDYSGYRLSLKDAGDIKFIVWENPEEDQKWLSSGYADGYEEGDQFTAMPIIGITDDGTIFKLAPEEKYSYTYSDYGNSGSVYGRNSDLNYPKIKREFEDSIWNYEG